MSRINLWVEPFVWDPLSVKMSSATRHWRADPPLYMNHVAKEVNLPRPYNCIIVTIHFGNTNVNGWCERPKAQMISFNIEIGRQYTPGPVHVEGLGD